MKITGIYQIQSKIKPKRIYIGCAINIEKRWKEHIYNLKKGRHHSFKLQGHTNKYGIGDLQFSIITTCEKHELSVMEDFFIVALHPWFNNKQRRNFNNSKKSIDEICRNISIALRGNKNRLGVKDSPETRKKKSKLQTGEGNSMYGKEPWNKGKKGLQSHTPEVKEKIRANSKRVWAEKKSKKQDNAA